MLDSAMDFAQHATVDLTALLLIVAVSGWLVVRERRRCRLEVRQAREHYRSILDNAPDAVVLFDQDFRVAEWNTAAERLYGIGRHDAVAKKLATIPLERWNELRALLERMERNQPVLDYESERIRANGARIPVALSYARMPAGKDRSPLYLEIAQDIRERLKMRDKLLEMEKLTLMGRMAAGTAHHLNTPLTAMLLQTEMLAARLRGREETEELALIKGRIRYCQGFATELLRFAHVPETHQNPVSLCEVLRAVAGMLRPTLAPKNADLVMELDPLNGVRVLGNANHFEAAFSALLSNAMDAIPSNGSIRIHGRVDVKGRGEIFIDDNGPGIPPELQASVLEPFFTTKPAGRGTGLGLPIARSIVERHGGTLQLQTRDGGGTRVTVRLPLLAAAETLPQQKETAA